MKQGASIKWVVGFASVAAVGMQAEKLELSTGHYDLAVDYTVASGWSTYVFDHGEGVRLDPAEVVFMLGESALTAVPAGDGFSFLGSAGSDIWLSREVATDPEVIWLGVGASAIGRDIFTGGLSNRGQIRKRLVSVEGSGVEAGGGVVLYQSGIPAEVVFSSLDGVGPEDSLDEIVANFHAHYNWAFTATGCYKVTFEYSGTLLPELGGGETSAHVSYNFSIGAAGFCEEDHHDHEHSGAHGEFITEGHAGLALGYDAIRGLYSFIATEDEHAHGGEEEERGHQHGGSELHAEDVIFVLGGYAVQALPVDGPLAALGDRLYRLGQSPEFGVPFFGFETEELDTAQFVGDIEFELEQVEGPGVVVLYTVGSFGEVEFHWDSRRIAAGAYTMPAGAHRHFFLGFTEQGEYRLHIHIEATLAAGGIVSTEAVLAVSVGGPHGYFAPLHDVHGDWIESEAMGWMNVHEWPWVWHSMTGWAQAHGEGGPEAVLYSPRAGGWIWTQPAMFPWAYVWNEASTGWQLLGGLE